MNPLTLILLAITTTSTFADQAIHESLIEIDQDPFGATLLNLISLNLQAQTPTQDLTNLLYDTRDDLQKDLTAVINNYNTKKGELEAALNNAVVLFGQYNATILTTQQSITSDTNSKQSRQNAITNTQGLLVAETTKLNQIESSHKIAVDSFASDLTNLNTAVTNTQNAIDKMSSFGASAAAPYSFLEVSSRAQKAVKKVTDHVGKIGDTLSKHNNRYQPLVAELAELTMHMEGPRSDAVVQLLNQLKGLLQTALQNTKNSQNDEIKTYQTEKTKSGGLIDSYNNQINQYKSEITVLDTRIQNSQKDLETAQQLKAGIETKYFADQKSLQDATEFYEVQRPKHERALEVLEKIISFFNTNIASVDDFTKNRINSA